MTPAVHFIRMTCTLVLCLTFPNVASGENSTKQRCAAAYDEAQVAMRQGRLLDAKRQLIYCSSSECPEIMHGDCQHWLSEVEASMPTVVFRIQASSGPAPDAGSVSIDGAEPVAIEGRALSVDPGKHDLAFFAPGFRVSTKAMVFAEGEKLRREFVLLDPLPAASATKARPAAPPKKEHASLASQSVPPNDARQDAGASLTLPLVLAATAAVAGVVGVTYFGLMARSEDHDLDTCTPNCSHDRVARIKQEYLLANASIGLAAAGFAATTLLLFLELQSEKSSQSAQLRVGAQPSGLSLSVGGRF